MSEAMVKLSIRMTDKGVQNGFRKGFMISSKKGILKVRENRRIEKW